MLSLLRVGLFNRGETRADLKCEGKESSESNNLIIDVISIIRISIQAFTKLVGIECNLYGDRRTRLISSNTS